MWISKRYPEHNVDEVLKSNDSYYIYMSTGSDASECPYCGSQSIVKFGSRELKIQDMPEKDTPVTLIFKQTRYLCNDCAKTFVITPEHKDIEHKVTKGLADYVATQSFTRSFTDIADEVGIHTNTARDIFLRYYQKTIDAFDFDNPIHLGLERANVVKPSTVITNISKCRVLGITSGQNVEDVKLFLTHRLDMSEVKYAYIGIWSHYKDLITDLAPSATIIIDKRHAFDLITQSVERVRVSVRSALSAIDRRSLSKDKNILAKRRYELTKNDKKILKRWCESHPEIYQAYELKERFYMIWDFTSSQDAKAAYSEWKDSITPAVRAYFMPLITLIDTWSNEVFAYFDNPKFNNHESIVSGLEAAASCLPRRRSFAAVNAALLFNKEKDQYGIKVPAIAK